MELLPLLVLAVPLAVYVAVCINDERRWRADAARRRQHPSGLALLQQRAGTGTGR